MVGVAVVFAVAFAVTFAVAFAVTFAVTFGMVGTVVSTVVTTTSVTTWAGVPVVIGRVVAWVVPVGVGVATVMLRGNSVSHPATKRQPTSTATRASSRAVFAIN